MNDIELNPTGEMLLDCMDKLERIQAKHTALVEAVKVLLHEAKAAPSLDNKWELEDGTVDYAYLIWDSDIRDIEQALAAAQDPQP